jgi:hypothetical protein
VCRQLTIINIQGTHSSVWEPPHCKFLRERLVEALGAVLPAERKSQLIHAGPEAAVTKVLPARDRPIAENDQPEAKAPHVERVGLFSSIKAAINNAIGAKLLKDILITYDAYVGVAPPAITDPWKARRDEGAGFLGTHLLANDPTNRIKVSIDANIFVPNETIAVLSVYVRDERVPRGVATVSAKGAESISLSAVFDVRHAGWQLFTLEARIGTTDGTMIYLNGTDKGPLPGCSPKLRVREYQDFLP